MRHQLTFVFLFLFAISLKSKSQSTYYIDQVGGNDANTGTSIGAPWKNLSKLYNLTITPGSSILLKAGSVWGGQQVKFSGSGTLASPIMVTKYGTGTNPIINGNGLTGQGVVYLYNQQYIEISNLEITNAPNGAINSDFFVGINNGNTNNNPLGADRRGVMVVIDNFGTASHIYLKNLNIHHIKGQLGNGTSTVNGAIPKRTGGIYLQFWVLRKQHQPNRGLMIFLLIVAILIIVKMWDWRLIMNGMFIIQEERNMQIGLIADFPK